MPRPTIRSSAHWPAWLAVSSWRYCWKERLSRGPGRLPRVPASELKMIGEAFQQFTDQAPSAPGHHSSSEKEPALLDSDSSSPDQSLGSRVVRVKAAVR